MASNNNGHHGHIDASTGRDVVYCHACTNEWYRDESGLTCPECHSDITEIISPNSDPRDLSHHTSESTSPELPPLRPYPDSDPDEADIEEHLAGDHGFVFNRTTRTAASGRQNHDPSLDPVLRRFMDMVNGLAPQGPPGRQAHPSVPDFRMVDDDFVPPRVHRTTFRSGSLGGGSASVTIISGPIHATSGHAPSHTLPMDNRDGFQDLFSSIMRELGPPPDDRRADVPPPPFMRSLQDILGLLNPAHAMAGDAVYSQEALDRIISNLMEANPQSNAAPPATDEALHNLARKPVDKEMLSSEARAECPICIDDLKEGDMAVLLPCKHWFHEECVVLWLKEHNTCPICRSAIEKREGDNTDSHSAPSDSDTITQTPAYEIHSAASTRAPPPLSGLGRWFQGSPAQSHGSSSRNFGSPSRTRDSRTSSYDTSRLQRRTSHSPTSPTSTRATGSGEQRHRHRSPSSSSRWTTNDSGSPQSSGQGPISWLRNRFSGSEPHHGSSQDRN